MPPRKSLVPKPRGPPSKMGDEEVWLGAIAPYVESGCIQVRGEDGDLWRWVLSGGKLKEIRPEIKWPEGKE